MAKCIQINTLCQTKLNDLYNIFLLFNLLVLKHMHIISVFLSHLCIYRAQYYLKGEGNLSEKEESSYCLSCSLNLSAGQSLPDLYVCEREGLKDDKDIDCHASPATDILLLLTINC